MPRNLSLFAVVCGTLLFGCASPAKHQPLLSRAEVLRIASKAAIANGRRLRNYERPQIHFELANSYEWGLYFDHKPKRNDNDGFLICIDDRTKEPRFYPYRTLPED